jgi:Methyltransferase domain
VNFTGHRLKVFTYMREILDRPHPLKRLIPAQIKRPVKTAMLSYIFRQAMRDLANLQPGEAPSRELLKKLRLGWDNQGWDAKLDYFEEIAKRVVDTEGPILECGSGLTTLVMGCLAGKRKVETWSLEHNADWHGRVSSAIKRHHLSEVNLCLSPLRDYGQFNWYDAPLAKMPAAFSLVICDGPPDLANGGRYGLLPVLGDRLESGTLILFDDAREPGQPEVLRRWETECRVRVELRETAEVSFALVTCP